jgi:hypothetical protein
MPRIAMTAVALALLASVPVRAEPVDNGSEVAQLLASLGDRCWAIDIDGEILDVASLAEIAGPIDIEIECVIEEAKVEAASTTKPLPASII